MVDASRKMASFERGMTHVFMLRIDGQLQITHEKG